MKKRNSFSPSRLTLTAMALGFVLTVAIPTAGFACESQNDSEKQLEELSDGIVERLTDFIEDVTNFIYNDVRLTATTEAITRLDEYNQNLYPEINRWWEKMGAKKNSTTSIANGGDATEWQKMTGQLSVAKIAQTMHIGMMIDAQVLQEVVKAKQDQKIESYRRNKINDSVCQVDSGSSTQTKADKTATGLARAWAVEDNKRLGNYAGSPSEHGSNAELAYLWQDYQNKFCDPAMGDQGCAATPGTRKGGQTDIPAHLWGEKQTIDLTDEDNRLMFLAAQQTLATPFSSDPIPEKVIRDAQGQEEFMIRRSKMARGNTIYNATGRLLGERVATKEPNDYIKEIRTKAGIPADAISNNPSYSEIRDTMARLRYMDPEYFARLAGPADMTQQEQNVIGAIRLQQMNDQYKRMEEMLALEAASYAADLDHQAPPSAIGDAPFN